MITEQMDLLARRLPSLWRWLAVLSVLILSFYLGRQPSLLLAALVAGVLGAILLLRRPELGLLGLVTGALVVPFSINTGTYTSLNPAILLPPALAALWLLGMVQRRDIRLASSPTNLPLLAFVISAVLSYLAGAMPWNYFADPAGPLAQLGGLALFVLSAVAFLLPGNQIKSLAWLERLVWLYLALGAIYFGESIVQRGLSLPPILAPGATGSLLAVWLVALAAGQAFFNRRLPRRWQLALAALAGTSIAWDWITNRGWVSGWLPASVALAVLIWLRSWRLGLAVSACALVFVMLIRPDVPQESLTLDEYSIATRGDAAQIMLHDILPISPIIGLGPANYYYYVTLYPIRGYYISFNSHNQYLDIVAQTGIAGLLAFAWLMLSIGRLGWGLYRRTADSFARGYACACLAGLCGCLAAGFLGDWFVPFVYNIGFSGFRSSVVAWMFLGGLVAISRIGVMSIENASGEQIQGENCDRSS